jgi:Putative adhesin
MERDRPARNVLTERGVSCGMRHHVTVAAALALAASPLLGQVDECRDHHWGDRAHYCEVRVEKVAAPSGTLDVDARENGAVEIIGRSAGGLVIHERVEAEAPTEEEAREIVSKVRVVTGARIHAEGPPEGHHTSWTVSYRIETPHRIDVSAESTNGPVEATDVVGHLDLRTENGPIELEDVGGDVHARTDNGPLEVTLNGAKWDGTGLDAVTENGPVELTLPENYAAHLETGTVNGPMSIGFPITVQGRIDMKRLSMDIGGGGPTVHVVTTNGPVTVDRR